MTTNFECSIYTNPLSQIRGGKKYDTSTADFIEEYLAGKYGDACSHAEALYRKNTGEFFLVAKGGALSIYSRPAQGCHGTVGALVLLTEDEFDPKAWAKEHCSAEVYADLFGDDTGAANEEASDAPADMKTVDAPADMETVDAPADMETVDAPAVEGNEDDDDIDVVHDITLADYTHGMPFDNDYFEITLKRHRRKNIPYLHLVGRIDCFNRALYSNFYTDNELDDMEEYGGISEPFDSLFSQLTFDEGQDEVDEIICDEDTVKRWMEHNCDSDLYEEIWGPVEE